MLKWLAVLFYVRTFTRYIIELEKNNNFFHLIMKMMKEQKEERIIMVEVVQELNNIKVTLYNTHKKNQQKIIYDILRKKPWRMKCLILFKKSTTLWTRTRYFHTCAGSWLKMASTLVVLTAEDSLRFFFFFKVRIVVTNASKN